MVDARKALPRRLRYRPLLLTKALVSLQRRRLEGVERLVWMSFASQEQQTTLRWGYLNIVPLLAAVGRSAKRHGDVQGGILYEGKDWEESAKIPGPHRLASAKPSSQDRQENIDQ